VNEEHVILINFIACESDGGSGSKDCSGSKDGNNF
jgi:hypothetical protein